MEEKVLLEIPLSKNIIVKSNIITKTLISNVQINGIKPNTKEIDCQGLKIVFGKINSTNGYIKVLINDKCSKRSNKLLNFLLNILNSNQPEYQSIYNFNDIKYDDLYYTCGKPSNVDKVVLNLGILKSVNIVKDKYYSELLSMSLDYLDDKGRILERSLIYLKS